MTRRRILLLLAVALPPLALAGIGISHPEHLTAASAEYWRDLHVITLPIFPLLGFAPWLVVRFARRVWLDWVVGILGFVYAAFYTGLDVLAGIGAGGLKLDDMGMATGTVFGLGRSLGYVGAAALIAAVVVVGIVSGVKFGWSTAPGSLVALVGSILLYRDHIYFPLGVIGQLCLAIGWVAVIIAIQRRTDSAQRTIVGSRPATSA